MTTIVGNNKVFSESIQNFSALPVRRVDTLAKVANTVDVNDAMTRLRTALAGIANVATSPAPEVEIMQFTPEGPLLAVPRHRVQVASSFGRITGKGGKPDSICCP